MASATGEIAASPPLATIKQASIVARGGAPIGQWLAVSIAIAAVVADFFVVPPHKTVREEWWLWVVFNFFVRISKFKTISQKLKIK